jgi:hypothetical protein
MAIMQRGMMMVMPHAIVHPIVPNNNSKSLTRKSMKFREA